MLLQAERDAAAAEAWWPPVAAALRALGQLYGALDSRTFGGLAQDAVAAATTSVQSASRAVAKREHIHSSQPRAPQALEWTRYQ